MRRPVRPTEASPDTRGFAIAYSPFSSSRMSRRFGPERPRTPLFRLAAEVLAGGYGAVTHPVL